MFYNILAFNFCLQLYVLSHFSFSLYILLQYISDDVIVHQKLRSYRATCKEI